MARREDPGMRVTRLAKDVTPEQCAELLAITLANMHSSQTSTHPSHWRKDGIYGPLVKAGLVVGQACPQYVGRGWKRALLTNRGARVLLHIAE